MIDNFFADISIPGCTVQVCLKNKVIEAKESVDTEALGFFEDEDIYFLGGVDPNRGKERAGDDHILKKNYTFFDWDVRKDEPDLSDEDIKELGREMLPPILDTIKGLKNWRYIVYTGNGLHIYYFAKDPIEVKDKNAWKMGMKYYIGKLNELQTGFDEACVNVARISRLPGTYNCKEEKKPVEILAFNDVYSDLLHGLESRGQAELKRIAENRKEIVNDSPGDVYDRINNLSIGDVVAKVMVWEFDGRNFREPGSEKTKACFVPSGENFLVHGGTDHFPAHADGYSPFMFVKEVKKLNNRETFFWFKSNFPQVVSGADVPEGADAPKKSNIGEVFERLKNSTFTQLHLTDDLDKNKFVIRGAVTRIGAMSYTGKCLHPDSMVLTPSGKKRIADMAAGEAVLCLDNDNQGRRGLVQAVQKSERKKCLAIRTNSGKILRCSPDHKINTAEVGYVKACSLEVGQHCLISCGNDFDYDGDLSIDDAKLLGYLVGDGCVAGTNFSISNPNKEVLEEIEGIAERKGWRIAKKWGNGCWYMGISSKDISKPANAFKKKYWGDGCKSSEKVIPSVVFTAGKRQKWLFINRLFACDSNVCCKRKGDALIEYTSASEDLVDDIQDLLLSLGVLAVKRKRKTSWHVRGERKTGEAFVLRISSFHLRKFLDHCGRIFCKEEQCEEAYIRSRMAVNRHRVDYIPRCFLENVLRDQYKIQRAMGKSRKQATSSWRACAKNGLRRILCEDMSGYYMDEGLLYALDSKVIFDRVVDISEEEPIEMYDIQVENFNNFFANGISVHNSKMVYFLTHLLLKNGYPGMIFSTEVPAEMVLANLFQIVVPEAKDIWDILEQRVDLPLGIEERYENLGIYDVKSTKNRLEEIEKIVDTTIRDAKKGGVEPPAFMVIDFVQMVMPKAFTNSEFHAASRYAQEIQEMAQRYNIAVIDTSQLNSAGMKDENAEYGDIPFRNSKDLYNNADIAIMLKRDRSTDDNTMTFSIRKHKYQKPAELLMDYNYKNGSFSLSGFSAF